MKKNIFLIIGVISLTFASCKFGSQSEVQYKVLHMQQNIENNEYTVFEEEDYTAAIGSKIKIQYKDYEGFTVQPVEQQIIKEGLSIPVYYDRNLITFNFNLAGGTGTEKITEKFGTPTKNIVQTPVKGLTRFTGWEPSLPDTFDKDTTFTATWNYPCYKVLYLFENPDDDCYSQNENFPEQIFSGIAGQMTSVQASEITGFTPLEIEQVAIHELAESEEIPVVTVKYNRNKITLFIDLNDGLGETYVTGKYGQTLNLENLPKPERPKYEFVQYEFIDSSYFSETYTLELNNKKVLRAVWKGEGQARYVIRVFAQNIYDDEYSEIGKYIAVGDSDTESNVYFEYTEKSTEHKLDIKSDSSVISTYLDSFIPAKNKTIENKKISGDETTRVDVYVDRLEYAYKFEYGKPDEQHHETEGNYLIVRGKYGQEVYVPELYKEGYTRNGTSWNNNRTPPSIYSGSSVENTYSVNWTANNYTIHFDKNYSEATGSYEDVKCIYDKTSYLPKYMDMKIYRPGYFIKEWNTKPDGSGYAIDYIKAWDEPNGGSTYPYGYPSFKNLTSEPEGEVTLYAQWEEIQLAEVKIVDFYTSYIYNGVYKLNLTIEVPRESRIYNKYYCKGLGSEHIPGVDAATPLLVYLNGELLKTIPFSDLSIAYGAANRNKKIEISYEMKPSYSYTLELKLGFPIKDDPQTAEDYITNTSSVTEKFHSSSVAQPSNLHLVDFGDGYMTFKWNNPDAEEIKSVTLNFGKSYEIDNLTPGAEVEYTVTGLIAGESYEPSVKTVDGTEQTGSIGGRTIKIPDFKTTELQKGQIYYADGSWSWEYDSQKNPVGVIFAIENGKPAKIFALADRKLQFMTQTKSINFDSVGGSDGSGNWEHVKQLDPSATESQYPAFQFCNNYKIDSLPSLKWYLPTISELTDICRYYNNYGAEYRAQVYTLKEKGVYNESIVDGSYWSSNGADSTNSKFYYVSTGYYYPADSTLERYVLPVAKLPQ